MVPQTLKKSCLTFRGLHLRQSPNDQRAKGLLPGNCNALSPQIHKTSHKTKQSFESQLLLMVQKSEEKLAVETVDRQITFQVIELERAIFTRFFCLLGGWFGLVVQGSTQGTPK